MGQSIFWWSTLATNGEKMTKSEAISVKLIEWFDDRFYKIIYTNAEKVDVEEYLASVTTKLGALAKPFLARWRGDLGNREADFKTMEAADRGSRTHWAWYTYINNGAVVFRPPRTPLLNEAEMAEIMEKYKGQVSILQSQDEMFDMMKLQEFCRRVKPEVLECERTVYDLEHKDAGTLDNLFRIKAGTYDINGAKPLNLVGGIYPFDLKTGKTIAKDSRMQLSAYAIMVEKLLGLAVAGALIGHTQASTKKGIEGFSTTVLTREEIDGEYQDYRNIAKVWERNFGTMKPKVRQIPAVISRLINESKPEPTPESKPEKPQDQVPNKLDDPLERAARGEAEPEKPTTKKKGTKK